MANLAIANLGQSTCTRLKPGVELSIIIWTSYKIQAMSLESLLEWEQIYLYIVLNSKSSKKIDTGLQDQKTYPIMRQSK